MREVCSQDQWLGFRHPHAHKSVCVFTSSCLGAVPAWGVGTVCSLGIFGQATALCSLDPSLACHFLLDFVPRDSCHLPLPMLLFLICGFSIWGQKFSETVSFNKNNKKYKVPCFSTTPSQPQVRMLIHSVTILSFNKYLSTYCIPCHAESSSSGGHGLHGAALIYQGEVGVCQVQFSTGWGSAQEADCVFYNSFRAGILGWK